MIEVEGKFLRQSKAGFVAKVTMTIDTSTSNQLLSIASNCDLPYPNGYNDWEQGAIAGLKYGLRFCGDPPYHITIVKIFGTNVDTNPTVVAVATIIGLWKGLNFQPSAELSKTVEQFALTSSAKPYNHVPNFDGETP